MSSRFTVTRGQIAARGLSEAENELAGLVRSGNRVVVSFAHTGEAQRQATLLRKVEAPPRHPAFSISTVRAPVRAAATAAATPALPPPTTATS